MNWLREKIRLAQVAEYVLSLALHEGTGSYRNDVLFDVYWKISIKNAKTCNCGATKNLVQKHIPRTYNPSVEKNSTQPFYKTSLIKFMVEIWNKPEHKGRLGEKILHATCEEHFQDY